MKENKELKELYNLYEKGKIDAKELNSRLIELVNKITNERDMYRDMVSEKEMRKFRDEIKCSNIDELEVQKKLFPEPINERQVRSELYEWGAYNNFLQREITDEGVHIFDAVELENSFIPKKEMENAIIYLESKFPQVDGNVISDIVKKYVI